MQLHLLVESRKIHHSGLRLSRHYNKLTITESQIATDGDLTFSLSIVCRVKFTLDES